METALYQPVKAFLETLGFAVKGEVGGCDLVALREGEPPLVVVGELKLRFSLELVLQAVDRAPACDEVWLAARVLGRNRGREGDARFRNLCRRLGFGMLGVTEAGQVDILVSPAAPAPRRDPRRRSRLVDEHRRRRGDPAVGGGSRHPIMTAYRQQALVCASAMAQGMTRPRDLRASAPDAAKILRRNVYGWFARADRGHYLLTQAGRAALTRWPQSAGHGEVQAVPLASEICGARAVHTRAKAPADHPLGGAVLLSSELGDACVVSGTPAMIRFKDIEPVPAPRPAPARAPAHAPATKVETAGAAEAPVKRGRPRKIVRPG